MKQVNRTTPRTLLVFWVFWVFNAATARASDFKDLESNVFEEKSGQRPETSLTTQNSSSGLTTRNAPQSFLNFYGGKNGNDYFQIRRVKAVHAAVSHIRAVREFVNRTGRDPSIGFRKHLLGLVKIRGEIARRTESVAAESFSLLRSDAAYTPDIDRTPIAESAYPQWNRTVKDVFRRELKLLTNDRKTSSGWKMDRGGLSRYRVSVMPYLHIPGRDLEELRNQAIRGESEAHHNVIQNGIIDHLMNDNFTFSNVSQMTLVRLFGKNGAVQIIRIESELSVDGEWIPLLNLYGWVTTHFDRDFPLTEKSFEFFEDSLVLAVHPPRDKVQTLHKKCASLWKEALEWDGRDLEKLVTKVAQFHYVLDNTMSAPRGSAAITEWMTEAIYQVHGFQAQVVNEQWNSILQEAMANPSLDQFVLNYKDSVLISHF